MTHHLRAYHAYSSAGCEYVACYAVTIVCTLSLTVPTKRLPGSFA